MKNINQIILLFLSGLVCIPLLASDRREYQHGVDFIRLPDGRYWLLWSSSPGHPPQGDQKIVTKDGEKCKYYNHDIFYSLVDPNNPVIEKQRLITLPEAQEPVSVAISGNGVIALTFEDGSDSDIANCDGIIQQRYQLFDKNLKPLSKLKKVAINGGHSGHIAAVGDRFVIAYAEGWIDEGGVDGAGSANDVLVDVVNSKGKRIYHYGIAVDKGSPRDWWPVVAGSDQYAMVVWQRYVPDSQYASLMFTVYDPQNNKLVKEISLLKANLVYYHYDVQYLASIKRFVIVGNYIGDSLLHKIGRALSVVSPRTFAYLLDEQGTIVGQWDASLDCDNCPTYFNHPVVRESQPAVLQKNSQAMESVIVLYPTKPRGVVAFNVTQSKIEVNGYIDGSSYWFPLGTDGIFLDENTAFFVNLTQQGLKTHRYRLQ